MTDPGASVRREQYERVREASVQWRSLQERLRAMQLSRQVFFATVPRPPRRKKLAKKALGFI